MLFYRTAVMLDLSFEPIGYKLYNGDVNFGWIKSTDPKDIHAEKFGVYHNEELTTSITEYEYTDVKFIPSATPDSDSYFYGWTDGLINDAPALVTVYDNKTYYGRFIPQNTHIVTVQANDPTYGKVSIFEKIFNDTERIAGEYLKILPCAEPNPGYEFTGWEPELVPEEMQTIKVTEDIVYKAIFKPVCDFEYGRLIFRNICNGEGKTDDNLLWTITSDAAESNFNATKGIHYGSINENVTNITLMQNIKYGLYKDNIVNITVNASTSTGVVAELFATVGGVQFGNKQTINSKPQNYTFIGKGQGQIVVTIQKPTGKGVCGLYCKSIIVKHGTF